MSATYNVTGMTCGHCVSAVTEEVSKIEGVTSVSVDLGSGTVTVEGTTPSNDQIREAIEEAGYELV